MTVGLVASDDMSSQLTEPHATRASGRRFWLFMAIGIGAVTFGGFARTFYLKPFFVTPELSPLVQVHGTVFTGWVLLFIVQTALVSARRTRVHRYLGVVGALVAAMVVVVGVLTVIESERKDLAGGAPLMSTVTGLVPQLLGPVVFGAFVTTGLWFRNRPEIHKRWMLFATVVLLPQAVIRLAAWVQSPAPLFLLPMFALAIFIHDWRTRGRIHSASWGATLLLTYLVLVIFPRGLLGPIARSSDTWYRFVSWLMDQP